MKRPMAYSAAMTTMTPIPPHRRCHDPVSRRYSSRVVFLERGIEAIVRPDPGCTPWQPTLTEYLAVYRAVGAPWMWHGRLEKGMQALSRRLSDSREERFKIELNGRIAGFCELRHAPPLATEILHCGLRPDLQGRGLGRSLLMTALDAARQQGATRVWLHTCSEDSAAALPFYENVGFRVFGTRLEWVTDPRHRGLLSPDTTPAFALPWDVSGPRRFGDAGSAAAPADGNRRE